MSSTSAEHRRILEQLPWYVNETLENSDRAGVEQHLEICQACQRELSLLQAMRSAAQAPLDEPAPDLLNRVMERIKPAKTHSRWKELLLGSGWWPRLALAELATLIFLAQQLFVERARYAVLSGEQTVAARNEAKIHVVFQAEAVEKDMREALTAIGGRIVSGPSAAGFYTIAVAAPSAERAVQELRRRGSVIRYAAREPDGRLP